MPSGTRAVQQRGEDEDPAIDPVDVRVYKFTGWQGIVKIPESWCRECDMFVRTADQAAEATDVPVQVEVIPWVTHVLGALRFGGYHPPVLVVDGERVAQGEDVPTVERVVDAIEQAATARRDGGGQR